MINPIMTCGHAANAKNREGELACAICGSTEVSTTEPDLSGRQARCSCGRTAGSENREFLAFFSYRPGKDFDEYYCGCWGWD